MCFRWWSFILLLKKKKKRKEPFSEMENADTPHDDSILAAANDVAKPPASGTVKKITTKAVHLLKNKKVVTFDEGEWINKLLL
jgi:hypothetical protein